MEILNKLKLADYLSFTGLFFSWFAILLTFSGDPFLAVVFMMIAFIFDMLDGYVARKTKSESPLGRSIDSFVDVFTYLIFSAVIYFRYMAPSFVLGVVVSFIIIFFGGLRLLRFNDEGILKENGKKYYKGITVLHVALIVISLFFLIVLLPDWFLYIPTITIIVLSPLMISNYKSYKDVPYWLLGVIIISIVITSLVLRNALFKYI